MASYFSASVCENPWEHLEGAWTSRYGSPLGGGPSPEGGSGRMLNVAVEGCTHGALDNTYATIQDYESTSGSKVDLLLCCGDFQATRNLDDLETLETPAKYRSMGDFHKYYSGGAVAPIPTVFVGGNHEAASHQWEIYYGGWAAPNMWFLGFAGCAKFAGLRIAGLSGIYNEKYYQRGRSEAYPYSNSRRGSVCYTRDFEVHRLKQLRQPIDIFLTHDWPLNIYNHGNKADLLARNPTFDRDVTRGVLGSPPQEQLLHALAPRFWFSGHMHTKWAGLVDHGPGLAPTRFLGLDKCLPRRAFLQVVQLEGDGSPPVLSYDEEWLAVLRRTVGMTNLRQAHQPLPTGNQSVPTEEDVKLVREALAAQGGPEVPQNFVRTAPAYTETGGRGAAPTRHVRNPQTEQLLDMLGLPYDLDHDRPVRTGQQADRRMNPPEKARAQDEEVTRGQAGQAGQSRAVPSQAAALASDPMFDALRMP